MIKGGFVREAGTITRPDCDRCERLLRTRVEILSVHGPKVDFGQKAKFPEPIAPARRNLAHTPSLKFRVSRTMEPRWNHGPQPRRGTTNGNCTMTPQGLKNIDLYN